MKAKWVLLLLAGGGILSVGAVAFASAAGGRVVDQEGRPVAGAAVHAAAGGLTEAADGRQEGQNLTAVTDENGAFALSVGEGTLRITAVKKEGYYLLSRQAEKANMQLAADSGETESNNGGAEPLVLIMHKSAGPAYLLCSRSQFRIKAATPSDVLLDMQSGRDITETVKRAEKASVGSGEAGFSLPEGLKIQSAVDPNKGIYTLTFTCPEDGSGIVISDEYYYEAPAEGYQATAAIEIPYSAAKAQECVWYVYLKAPGAKEGQWRYCRMELELTVGKAALIADVICRTNPSGSRNLEFDEKFQKECQAALIKQLREAQDSSSMSPEELEELRQLAMNGIEQDTSKGRRWDFNSNRRRAIEEKRQKQLEAEGRLPEKN